MYLGRQTIKISIGEHYQLHGVHQVEIKKSVHQIVQTAKVELPLSAVIKNQDINTYIKLADKIKEGDSIKLEFGYDGNNRLEFDGYVRRMNYKTPFVLECEDELYLLRKTFFKKSFLKSTLKEIVQFVLDGVQDKYGLSLALYDKMPEMSFSNFQMKEANGIDVLQELKSKYGLNSFITVIGGKKTLYVGLMYGLQGDTAKYVFNKNTISTDDLKYSGTEEKRYQIKIVNFNTNGTTLTINTGDKNGEQRTLYFYGTHTEADLKHMADVELQKYSKQGYKGSFQTFLFPYIEPCMIASMTDPQFAGRSGNHYCGTVTTTFGVNGARRQPEVDFKIF